MAAGQSQRFYSGVGIFNFNWYYLSSPPQILRIPVVELETRGLMLYQVVDTRANLVRLCSNAVLARNTMG